MSTVFWFPDKIIHIKDSPPLFQKSFSPCSYIGRLFDCMNNEIKLAETSMIKTLSQKDLN